MEATKQLYRKYQNSNANSRLRSNLLNKLEKGIESEEFVKNQNCYINLRKNSPIDRYAEIGATLGLHYQSAYDQMMQDA